MGEQVAEFTDKYGEHFLVLENKDRIRYIIKTTMGKTHEQFQKLQQNKSPEQTVYRASAV